MKRLFEQSKFDTPSAAPASTFAETERYPHTGLPASISRLTSDLVDVVSIDHNFICSPYSIEAALSMVLLGARNKTADELAQALHVSCLSVTTTEELQDVFRDTFSQNRSGMTQRQDLWLDKKTPFYNDYIKLLHDVFRANSTVLDFNNTVAVVKQINDEVNEFTHGKVPALLSLADIRSVQGFFPAILTNMLFHKGSWAQAFDPSKTYTGPFWLTNNETVPVQYMTKQGTFKYLQGSNCEYLALPYADCDAHFVCVLPLASHHWRPTVSQVYSSIRRMDWKNLIASIEPTEDVTVTLPKFKMTQSPISLVPKLSELGIVSAFDEELANFSGMTPIPNYYISNVLHAAGIEIDEMGSEAGAATAVMMRLCIVSDKREFSANRPFAFFIIGGDGTVYFSGRLCDPSGPECS